MTTHARRSVALLLLSLLSATIGTAGCSDRPDGGVDGGPRRDAAIADGGGSLDAARDGSTPIDDAATLDDATTATDATATDDATAPGDASAPSDGAIPRPDAHAASDAGAATDGCPPLACPSPPPGCSWVGAGACTCGRLECPEPPGACEGPGTGACASSEYCMYEPGTCGGVGTCTAMPEICDAIFDPVCGCDGATYGNECYAAADGQSVAFEDECPPPPDCRVAGCPGTDTCQACLAIGGISYVCLPEGAVC